MPKAIRAFISSGRRIALATFAICALSLNTASSEPTRYAPAIETLAGKLGDRFVDPAVGKRYAAMLRANLATGRYDAITEPQAIAERLTQDLQALARDGHLRVDLAPEYARNPNTQASATRAGGEVVSKGPRPGAPAINGPSPRPPSRFDPLDMPSVAETKWIGDDVAYIRFNHFGGESASITAVEAFMREHVDAKAIIIDTRTLSRGGGIAEMDVMFPYLFARETVLVNMAIARANASPGGPGSRLRARGPGPSESATLREVAGSPDLFIQQHVAIPHPTEHRLNDAQVFYLTSERTRSAAEHFALALQRTQRGTIIGTRTAGANHFGGVETIGNGLAAFIPVARTYDPDTGKDWERVGITPDIEIPADAALDKALSLVKH
jgi:hypothetical protein